MRNIPIALTIRTKKLGVLIRDARLASGKSVEECAQAIGVASATFEAFEVGEHSPSLPELEVLAYFLDIPMEHFWGDKAISSGNGRKNLQNLERLVGLRQRVVGAIVRQARQEAGLSLEILAESVGFPASEIEAYELGEKPIPLPVLESLSSTLERPLKDFQDHHGLVGVWAAEKRAIQEFLALSPELQAFVCKPINRPYLELAQRLSEMSVEKLRSVAEGLLEITL